MGQQKHITSEIKQDSASGNESDTLCRGIQNYPDCSFAVTDGGRCPSNLEECIYPQIIGLIYRGMNKFLPQSVCLIIGGEKGKRKTKSFGWTATEKAKEFRVYQLRVSPTAPLSLIPLWVLPNPKVALTLLGEK